MSTKLKIIVLFTYLLSNTFSITYSQNINSKDSVKVNASDVLVQNSTKKKDSTKKPILEGIVKRTALDYERFDPKNKRLTLYNKAELFYQDYEVKSGIIVLDYDKNIIAAGRLKDSTGKYTQYPYFKQGENIIEPDSIRYNTKTGKAKIWNTKTKQGELNILAELSKRENDSVIFFKRARFTTSTNLEDPEYYFLAYRSKFVPKKKFVTGLTHMFIYNVPTPIGIPFAYFPITEKSQSGVLMPTPGQAAERGYFLQNGGYYFALSDNYDLSLLGDYFTNGSYGLRAESNYAKRYKFNGFAQVRYENQINGDKGFPGYTKFNQYNITWTHNQDAKASANSRFGASVNFGSSQFARQSYNIINAGNNLNNTMSSSINYSKTFQTIPIVNITAAATHNQSISSNTATPSVVNMSLPNFNASIDRVFPFAKEDGIKKGIIQNISLQYNIKGENRINTTEDLLFKSGMFDKALTGFIHTIPLSTNFKVFKYFSITSGINYSENWVLSTIKKQYNSTDNKVESIRDNGFDSFRTYNFSSSIGTTVYGMYTFKEKSNLQAIRHTLRPSISYGYTPSFNQYYEDYLDANGLPVQYTRFEGGIVGTPGNSISNSMGISLANTLEAKVKDDTTKEGSRKISLLSQLNFNASYNFAAEKKKLSIINMNGGTKLFKDRLDLNFGAQFDPYDLDESLNPIDEYLISNGNGLVRMTNAAVAFQFNVNDTDFSNDKKAKKPKNTQNEFGETPENLDTDLSLKQQTENRNTQSDLYKMKIPWNLRFRYTLNYNNEQKQREITINSLSFDGDFDITSKWKFGFGSGYDFAKKGISFTTLRIERDLESWRMSFFYMPISPYTSWSFFIGIKSSILQDIKWDKRSLPDPRLR